MRKVAFLIASLVIASQTVVADDSPRQTPENAHRFLKIVVEQNGLDVEKYTPAGNGSFRGPFNVARFEGRDGRNPDIAQMDAPWVDGYYYMYPFQADSAEGEGCHSVFKLPYTPYAKQIAFNTWGNLNRPDATPRSERLYNVELHPNLNDGKVEVDWSKVSGITIEEVDGKARITAIGGGRFTVPTMDLGKRVQFAMEFLKNACDPTASTGF